MKAIASDDAIRAAALALHQQDPASMTITNVIASVGGGSRSTVAPILKEIRQELSADEQTSVIPAALRVKVEALLQTVMTEASIQASQEFLARSARTEANLAAMEADAEAAAAEIDGLNEKLAEIAATLEETSRQLAEKTRRVEELETALVDEKVRVAETQRLLDVAWAETASLRREQSHATVIDARIEQLTSLVADLSVKAPKRRGRPPVSRHGRDESPVG